MSEGKAKSRRVGRVVAKHKETGEKFSFSGIFSPFPGAYSLGLAVGTDDGFDRITAFKTEAGKKFNANDYYFNMYVNEDLVPYETDK